MSVCKACYKSVRDVLALNIRDGSIPPGTRLFAAAAADRLSVSRSPVKRALDLLADEDLVTRDGTRGYVVVPTAKADAELANLHKLDLETPEGEMASRAAPGWEMIERDILNAIPIGVRLSISSIARVASSV